MDKIDLNNIQPEKTEIDLILEKINEIVDWINSQ